MPSIMWDEPTKRVYQTGVDRGVLYLGPNSVGIPWNGLISIDETFDESKSTIYLDGVKQSDLYSNGDFKATISAYTYPDEFLEYQGIETLGSSRIDLTDQDVKPFGLSYRTLIGNDTVGLDYGYQIHILYNLIAVPEDTNYSTYSSKTDIANFQWTITGLPENVAGFRSTAHAIIDSRFLSAPLLDYLETILYGPDHSVLLPAEIYPETREPVTGITFGEMTDYISEPEDPLLPASITPYVGTSPVAILPPLNDLVNIILNFDSTGIIPDSVTGLATLAPGYSDLTPVRTDGIFYRLPASRLVPGVDDQFYTFDD